MRVATVEAVLLLKSSLLRWIWWVRMTERERRDLTRRDVGQNQLKPMAAVRGYAPQLALAPGIGHQHQRKKKKKKSIHGSQPASCRAIYSWSMHDPNMMRISLHSIRYEDIVFHSAGYRTICLLIYILHYNIVVLPNEGSCEHLECSNSTSIL